MQQLYRRYILDGLLASARVKLYVWLSLATQIGIVVTGGGVRLTGSGLGCPTWPMCTEDSLVSTPEMGIHGVIEFGNRLLTFVLLIVAILTFATVFRIRRQRRGLTSLAVLLGLGIIIQAVIGGITVLMGLNPWVVGLHFVVSAVLIAIAALLVWRALRPYRLQTPALARPLSTAIALVGTVTILIGVVVTGAGPHAGDANTPRNGLDREVWQHYHSYPGYLMTALLVLQLGLLARSLGWQYPTRITALTLGVALSQAVVGVISARTGVPPLLVAIHMLGAAVLSALLLFQWVSVRNFRKGEDGDRILVSSRSSAAG
jgi:cytochrome c oxidase assembly protein subunit 15